jgi:hypothetical protein
VIMDQMENMGQTCVRSGARYRDALVTLPHLSVLEKVVMGEAKP